MKKIKLSNIDRFLRKELGIQPGVSILVVSNLCKGHEQDLRNSKVCGTFRISNTQPQTSFCVIYRHDLCSNKLLDTLIHEYTHISQISSGRWVLGDDFQIWENKKIPISRDELALKKFKFTSPWELEAYSNEKVISDKFKMQEQSIITPVLKNLLLWING